MRPMPNLPDTLNVLLFMDGARAPVDEIAGVAPGRLRVVAVPGQAFEDDAGLHPPTTGLWKGSAWSTDVPPDEREAFLRDAHILVVTLPFPKRLLPRMPNLLWAQYLWAGISDMRYSDLWGSRVRVGSSRGYVETLPIAEMVMAASLHFAKELGLASRQTAAGELDAAPYRLRLLAGKTMGVVGLGGIGLEIARLAKALGMRVVATRRSAERRAEGVGDVDVLLPPSGVGELLAESDYVALAPVLTEETEGMMDAPAFASMKDGAALLNVGRGELVVESALKDALHSGKLRGAYLDVYADEWSRPPDPELMALPNVVMTPHNSGHVDEPATYSMDVLKENIRRFLAGDALINEVDWARGY